MNKLRSLLPGQQTPSQASNRHSVVLEPEIGFQITIDTAGGESAAKNSTAVPELNVHLIAARHLPSLFGFKIVQGYLIKVKLFPGTKRLDSSIQTNTWPKFNENFKFPLVPDIKSSLKHGSARDMLSRRSTNTHQTTPANHLPEPDELFAGQFVVFTVYALLELPAAVSQSTYRSLKERSSNFVQRLVESSPGSTPNESKPETLGKPNEGKSKKKSDNPRDAMPPLTISESRRNIGSVTCYLEPKLFKRNARTGCYSSEELWLPIKDITTTVSKTSSTSNNNNNNTLNNSPKGVVELALEVRDLGAGQTPGEGGEAETPFATPTPAAGPASNNWQRMTAEMKRKMGMSNASSAESGRYVLRVTTTRMRCSNKVKDELEATASAGVYVKTTAFEHGIYIDAWKSPSFFPSLSTKWDDGTDANEGTIAIPLRSLGQLENIVVRVTLATKKMGKKLVLGTVLIGGDRAGDTGSEQMRLIRETPPGERVAAWHCYH
ncbi:uncharacterized protein LOC111076022 isoform X2 [Drosophila obscura]|uniref:uncharacterized protein LOC111076022 isoform X2 n=1 Tax=Drosophila obscura TaxID=7282 RepID=UPI001BB10A09|nr:uncharacterized protein LOC111076022 isoform X2 [Drosophila obscura]